MYRQIILWFKFFPVHKIGQCLTLKCLFFVQYWVWMIWSRNNFRKNQQILPQYELVITDHNVACNILR
ncbi:unnamed protein product [Schistosoma spindalis]|nr:unnamed protein product [Schistosoma spindale]